jgi:hypothetical protein
MTLGGIFFSPENPLAFKISFSTFIIFGLLITGNNYICFGIFVAREKNKHLFD